jgi:hypothetical protein
VVEAMVTEPVEVSKPPIPALHFFFKSLYANDNSGNDAILSFIPDYALEISNA